MKIDSPKIPAVLQSKRFKDLFVEEDYTLEVAFIEGQSTSIKQWIMLVWIKCSSKMPNSQIATLATFN